MEVLSLLSGWSLLAALVACLGAVAGRWVVVPVAAARGGVPAGRARAEAARIGVGGAALLLLALILVLGRQLLEFRDPFVPWAEDAKVLLTATSWGAAWRWAALGAVLALGAFEAARRGRAAGWWIASPVVLALGGFPAFTGHAAATGPLRPVTLAADTLHVWSAGGWLGGLVLVLVLDRRWRRSPPPEGPTNLLPPLVAAFSPLAVACVGTLVVTGVAGAWVQLPGVTALATEPYGRLLVLKVALALLAFGLGAVNWRRLTPRLLDPDGPAALRRSAALEVLVAQAVLLVTALLVRTSP